MTQPYSSLPNEFRRNLIEKNPQIGCWCSLVGPISAEILGYAGFDWLLIDGEHTPNDIGTIVSQLMALKDSVSAPVVRPPWAEPIILKRLLDVGCFNFLMPFINNAEEAEAAVAATRYPPDGIRGVALSNRGNMYGFVPNYHAEANENIAVMVQIESREGLENVEAIARVEGVDGLFIGPSDLSTALGRFGDLKHPDVQDAIKKIVDVGKATDTAVGIVSPVEEDARRYLDMGMTFVAVGVDMALLKFGAVDLRKKFKP